MVLARDVAARRRGETLMAWTRDIAASATGERR